MRSLLKVLQGTVVPGLLLLLWEVAVRSGAISYDYIPSPSAIFLACADLLRSHELVEQTAHTFSALALGWCAAAVIGVLLGLLFGLSRPLQEWVLPSLEVLRPLPSIAFLPVAILLFNFSLQTELVLIVYASVWPTFINTMLGVMRVPSQLREVCKVLRLTRIQTAVKVVIPAAAPAIFVGCRISLGLSLVMAIVAEMIGSPHGLGYAVISELQAMQAARMFAYILYISVIAVALNSAFTYAVDFVLRHHSARGRRP